MTGIVIIMVQQQVMEMRNGLFITLGANVGTCVTALIGIIGANTNSKRTALIHFIFNMSGCIIFTPILWIFSDSIITLLDSLSDENAMKIANKFYLRNDPKGLCHELTQKAIELWEEKDVVIDDITLIVVFF